MSGLRLLPFLLFLLPLLPLASASPGCEEGPLAGSYTCLGDYENRCHSGESHPASGARVVWIDRHAPVWAGAAAEGNSRCDWRWFDGETQEVIVVETFALVWTPAGPAGVIVSYEWGERRDFWGRSYCSNGPSQAGVVLFVTGFGVGGPTPCSVGVGAPNPGWGHLFP